MNVDRIIIIQARNNILRSLSLVYPSGLRVKLLFQTVCGVNDMYDMSLLTKDVAYLKEKKYVEYLDDKIGGMDKFENRTVKITAKGLEIIQDIIDDPALEI